MFLLQGSFLLLDCEQMTPYVDFMEIIFLNKPDI